MPFTFNREYPADALPAEPANDGEDLDAFRKVLRGLSEAAAQGEALEVLYRCIKIVHCGGTVVTPRFEPGLAIYRARKVTETPRYKREISYPPARFVKESGRCNSAGESIFYGSIGQASAPGIFYECRAKPGDLFAVGIWETTQPLVANHLGYSSSEINGRVAARPVANWMVHDQPNTRNGILRSWASEVFTKVVAPGDERSYNLSIALSKFALEELRNVPPDVPSSLGGIIYPSVCTNLMLHNVALKPSFVEAALNLRQVDLVRVRSIEQAANHLAVNPLTIAFDTIDAAMGHRNDGWLIWSGQGTWLSAAPFV
jgi:hypothetical protein